MCEVVIQTEEPDSTKQATKRMVNMIEITHSKSDLEQVSNNATQLNNEERTKLLGIIKEFQDLFDSTLG